MFSLRSDRKATLCSETSDVSGGCGESNLWPASYRKCPTPPPTHTHISTSVAPCCCLRATPAGSGSAGEPGGIVDRLRQINTRTGKCAKEEKSSTCSVVRGDYGVDRFSVKQYNSGFFFPLLFSSLPHFLITCRPGRDTFLWQRYFDKSAKYSNGTFVYNFHCFLTFFHFYLHVAFIPSLFPFFIFFASLLSLLLSFSSFPTFLPLLLLHPFFYSSLPSWLPATVFHHYFPLFLIFHLIFFYFSSFQLSKEIWYPPFFFMYQYWHT